MNKKHDINKCDLEHADLSQMYIDVQIPKIPPVVQCPEPSGWKCEMIGSYLVIFPTKGNVPNWFHRFMQRLCFGFKWIKIKD
jgi:hypothetical protein